MDINSLVPESCVVLREVRLGYEQTSIDPETQEEVTNTVYLKNLLEVPEIGGDVDKVEVTTLTDRVHTYVDGLANYNDLTFKFLYDAEEFEMLYKKSIGSERTSATAMKWKLNYGMGVSFEFLGKPNVKLTGGTAGGRAEYTLTIIPTSYIYMVEI